MGALENERHEKYRQLRASGKGRDESFAEAGYTPSPNNAARLASRQDVKSRIAELMANAISRVEIDIAAVVQELAHIATFDIQTLLDPKTGNFLPPNKWPEGAGKVISMLHISEIRHKNGRIDRKFTPRTWSKLEALDKLAKHFGMFVNRTEVNVTIDLAELTDDELDREIQGIFAVNDNDDDEQPDFASAPSGKRLLKPPRSQPKPAVKAKRPGKGSAG